MIKRLTVRATARGGVERTHDAQKRQGNRVDDALLSRFDRAFRSTIEGITFLDDLHADGITFESIYQSIDTRTPEGRKA